MSTEPPTPATTVRVTASAKAASARESATTEPAASSHGLDPGPPAHAGGGWPDSVQPSNA